MLHNLRNSQLIRMKDSTNMRKYLKNRFRTDLYLTQSTCNEKQVIIEICTSKCSLFFRNKAK